MEHPKAQTVLVLGILSLVLCGPLGIVALVMGNNVLREIDESHGQMGGRSTANAGRTCGIIGIVLLVVQIVLIVVLIAGGLAFDEWSSTTDY